MDDAVHGPNRPVVAKAPGASAPPAASVHVLLVDDERLTRTVVANLLHKCGYRVTSASDGMEALQLLRNSAPDTFQLVLTDVCMPELNGIQLLSCVKQDASLRAVPVVMMSSVDQEETVAECVQQGAEEYLVKPVTKKEVQHIWQHVWRKRCAAATVPQLPLEAAAAVAAAAAAAASHQHQQRQGAAAAAAARGLPAGLQDVQQQPSTSGSQQQQQLVQQLGSCIDLLIRSSLQSAAGSLLQRQSAFTAAVNLVQAAHLQQRALLCLRPTQLLFCEQHGLTAARLADGSAAAAAAGPGSEVDSLYVSPEEAAGRPSCQSDIFSLGLLFVDLFFPCVTQEQRCAQLRAARAAVLPPVLAGTHTAGSPQAVQDLLHCLLQADPARRPTVHAIIRAGILQDAYRLVQQLPHWRLLPPLAPAAAFQPQQRSITAAPTAATPAPAASGPAASAAPRMVLPPGSRVAAVLGTVDHDAIRHFLLLLRKSKQQELAEARAKLAALDTDLVDAAGRRRQCSPSAAASSLPAAAAEQEAAAAAVEQTHPSKRARLAVEPAATGVAETVPPPPLEQQQRLAAVMPQLEEVFFQRRQQLAAINGPACQPAAGAAAVAALPVPAAAAPAAAAAAAATGSSGRHLEAFARDLNELAAHSRLELRATLRSGDLASPVEMACCAAFDRDDEFFATVGVSRRVKIFDFAACLEGGDSVMHYPALQITTRSKLSSVCWNSYVKSQLITSDYSGLIQLWDASTAAEAAQYDEHARRVWSVDFSTIDPMRFLSGSDDGSVRLWSVHEQSSVSRIAAPANVCSVQFSPTDSHTIAFGCANYRVYLYDLRHTAHPLAAICGPQRAVSYVRFLGGSHLVSASTDSALRLWDLRELAPVTEAASSAGATSGGASSGSGGGGGASNGVRCCPAVTYTGHRNQRNFVGLSVSSDGRILCGSEDNSVHCYSRSLPFSTARYSFARPEAAAAGAPAGGGGGGEAHHQPFVSAVCWANRSRHCLVANSQGLQQILQLE